MNTYQKILEFITRNGCDSIAYISVREFNGKFLELPLQRLYKSKKLKNIKENDNQLCNVILLPIFIVYDFNKLE